MSEVGIRALKQNASAVVAKVVAGDAVTITDRGRPVAQMVPLVPSRVEALIESSRFRKATRSLSELPPPARRGRSAQTLTETLDEMRNSEHP